MSEKWRSVIGFEGLYEISNLGRVKSLSRKVRYESKSGVGYRLVNEKILKMPKAKKGNREYTFVCLSKNNKKHVKYIHILVAEAFLYHEPNGHKLVVDHINNNPLDNRVDNLQIITQRENLSKDKNNKYSDYTGVSWNKTSKKWVAKIYCNGKNHHLGYFKNELDAKVAYENKLSLI